MAGVRGRFFEAGELRIAILSLLSDGPKHGYQLMKEMKERSGGTYQASAGSVYPTLQQLEDEGLIVSEREDGRRVYHLTDAGRSEVESNPESAKRIWERAESWDDWGKNYGPIFMGAFGPMGELIRSSVAAAKWAAGKPERQEQLSKIFARTCREMDELTKK
jgi:DNA-binding PadR family transcriptional regulator